jgi:predicted alpha/beta superfamily hydrolase
MRLSPVLIALGAASIACASHPSGRLERHPDFPSAVVPPREVDVWLPPGYDTSPAERYPVIYMTDGQNIFEPSTSYGGTSWEVDKALERMIAAGTTRGAIVVGIWNTGMGRMAEYMPRKAAPTDDIKDVTDIFDQPSRPIISDQFLKFVVDELKPHVDRAYRTLPRADHTFMMGSSMGGLISAYAIAEYPGVFGGAACLSTHWPAGGGSVIEYLKGHLPDPATHRIYFDHGTGTLDSHYAPFQARMDGAMRSRGYQEGVNWVTRVFPGAEHSEKSWRARVEIPLAFLLQAAKPGNSAQSLVH